MTLSPTTAALIASLPENERELLEAFGVWRLRARPANGTSDLCRLSIAGDKNPALRPHILAVLRSADARLTAEGVLMSAEALLKGEPAPTAEPIRAPSRKPAPAVALTLAIPSAEEIEAAIEEEETEPEYGDLFPIVVKSAPAGVIATAWGWREEALPPALPSASVEASTPSERTAWIDGAFSATAIRSTCDACSGTGWREVPRGRRPKCSRCEGDGYTLSGYSEEGGSDSPPTLDGSEAPAPAPASVDSALLEIAPAWSFEGERERVFVRSRSNPTDAYAVTVKGGVATACSCPSRTACWHLEAALMAEAWEEAARRLIASEGLGTMRALWECVLKDAKDAGRRQVAAAMRRFCLTV